MNRFIPGGNRCKRAVLVLVLLGTAGCGGSGEAQERTIHGADYSFSAPMDWQVARSARELRASSGISVVSVTRFPLLRTYRPALWPRVVPELDRAADAVARQQTGTVTQRATVQIAERNARHYQVAYEHEGRRLVEELGFVLVGKTEFLLLCRYERGGETAACDRLLATFTLD
jgi:hypothetical protein